MCTSSSIRTLLALVAVALAAVALAATMASGDVTRGEAAPLGKEPALDSNVSCKACHEATFSAWRASRHAKAGRNAAFNFEYDSHPGSWCMGCHAPRSTSDLKLPRARSQGVDCLTCHVRAGVLHARTRSPSSPHKTQTSESFGGPTMCAGCHQFNFPVLGAKGELLRYTEQPMQNTFGEYRNSGSKAECIDCHMQAGTHRFPGAYVPDKVQEALT